ncbi:MAG TPA: hypothetical protein VIC63_01135 [Candidatus Limnocylindria bacterium]|jgi:hypothetical protein
MKWLLRLYPPSWRARYETEMATLIDELPPDRRMALDLFRGAFDERLRAAWRRIPEAPLTVGGPPASFRPFHRHPTTLALVALALVAPTATFVILSFLTYELGLTALRTIVEPALISLNESTRLLNLALLAAPFLAFVVALAPLVGIGLSRASTELRLTLSFHARTANLVVIALCMVVGGILAGHIALETLLEAT